MGPFCQILKLSHSPDCARSNLGHVTTFLAGHVHRYCYCNAHAFVVLHNKTVTPPHVIICDNKHDSDITLERYLSHNLT